MATLPPFVSFLSALFIFIVPGLLALALLALEDRLALALDEALFLMVAVSVLFSAWLGLVLAERGCFSLPTAGALLAGVSLLGAFLGRRRLGWPWRRPMSWREAGRQLAPAAAVLALALTLQARPSEYIVGGRDPGAYVAAMGVIGRTHGILYQDPLVRSIPAEDLEIFYGKAENPSFSGARFMGFDLESPASGRVFPQFFHLFPVFGAYLFEAMGVRGALATPCLFAVLGTLAVFFTLRRLFGPAPGLLAALLLGLNVVQVWFARYPMSEMLSQFLIFLGLFAFLLWEERGAAGFAALAGLAFGASLLVRIDSFLIVAPLGAWLAIRLADGSLRWRKALVLLVPFTLLGIHAAVHAVFFTLKYLIEITNRPYWRHPPAVWIALLGSGLVALLLAKRFGPAAVALVEARARGVQALVALAIVVLALYAYFLRPELSLLAGADGNDPALALADLGPLKPLGFQFLAAHDAQSLVRLGWFVTPLGLLLGTLGLLVCVRDWKPRYLLPVLTALTFSLFYLYKIRVYNDYYFALRRYVPVTIPFLLGLTALFLVRLAARGRWLRTAAGVAAFALAAAFARDTARLRDPSGAFAGFVDWRNSVRFVADVARRFGPDDAVIFEQPRSVHLVSLPLWAHFGVNAIELARFNPDPDRLRHLVDSWRSQYRNIYFVHTYRTSLCGLFLQRVEDQAFGTYEWERSYSRPPEAPEGRALRFTISRVVRPEEMPVPPLPEVDVGGSDDLQVSGFFDKEGGEGHTFRWSGACGSIYFPGARPGARLAVRGSVGRRPATSPARVEVSFSGQPLGSFLAGPEWKDERFTLPSPLPPGPPLLRFDVPAFRPSNVWPGDEDARELGLMLDRIWLVP